MITVCESCGKTFEKKLEDISGDDLVPNICNGFCFSFMLKKLPHKALNSIMTHSDFEWIHSEVEDFKSEWEATFSQWLISHHFRYVYEPFLHRKKYVPDFLIRYRPAIVEVKGRWEPGAMNKVRKLRAALDGVMPVFVVDRNLLRRIQK